MFLSFVKYPVFKLRKIAGMVPGRRGDGKNIPLHLFAVIIVAMLLSFVKYAVFKLRKIVGMVPGRRGDGKDILINSSKQSFLLCFCGLLNIRCSNYGRLPGWCREGGETGRILLLSPSWQFFKIRSTSVQPRSR